MLCLQYKPSKMSKKKIPIDRRNKPWINYNGKVLIIKSEKTGNKGRYQYNGCSCSQGSITGFVVQSFASKSKYFNLNFWYKKTVWATDNNRLYFDSNKRDKKRTRFVFYDQDEKKTKKNWQKIQKYADDHALPVDKILKTILKEVNTKTGKKYELAFDELEYGKHWFEARIPIKLNGEKYLLTWMNCD